MSRQIIYVFLETFLRTGILEPIRFGMTSEKIEALLGEPDMIWRHRRRRRPRGFEYGEIEFYFTDTPINRLQTIYLDHFDIPYGNKMLHLDPWFIRGAMPRLDVEAKLTEAGISFQPKEMLDPGMDGIVTASGVELGFTREDEDYSPPAGLYNISRSLREQFEQDVGK